LAGYLTIGPSFDFDYFVKSFAVRAECTSCHGIVRHRRAWGASSEAYFRVDELLRQLANPNLHDIPRNLPFRVEMSDQSDQHIRWVIAASASVAVGHAALDAAIANYPD
jgi:hypothetical protein